MSSAHNRPAYPFGVDDRSVHQRVRPVAFNDYICFCHILLSQLLPMHIRGSPLLLMRYLPHSGFCHIRVLTAYSFLLLSASARSYLTISITHIVSSHLNVFDKSLRLGLLKAGDVFHWNPLQGSRCFPFQVNSPRNALSPLLSVLGCPPPIVVRAGEIPSVSQMFPAKPVPLFSPYRLPILIGLFIIDYLHNLEAMKVVACRKRHRNTFFADDKILLPWLDVPPP